MYPSTYPVFIDIYDEEELKKYYHRTIRCIRFSDEDSKYHLWVKGVHIDIKRHIVTLEDNAKFGLLLITDKNVEGVDDDFDRDVDEYMGFY